MEYIKELLVNISLRDVIDVLVVAYVFYKLYKLIEETRAEQLLKGIVVLLIFTKISEVLHLYTINFIFGKTIEVGLIALLIVFQPELRKGLERMGRTRFLGKSFVEIQKEEQRRVIDEIVEAIGALSRQNIGALIVLKQKTGLNDVIDTGTHIDGKISSGLLINIFIPNTPLHDGAVVIEEDEIKAAGCLLPLTDNKDLNKDLGTRHRAAIGITEDTDCVVLVVSEETGAISYVENAKIERYLDLDTLRNYLKQLYNYEEQDRLNLITKWRSRNEA
ncbi:MAG: diadenylate cyclase CdaA [Tissierellales bacterium]|jgi:diadenylate cyclase|nr:diadenylate cyclase CdaA [Tissierellales bacterium]